MKDSFNLYLLNNSENGENGFIAVNGTEKEILISLSELINLFQNKSKIKIKDIIINQRLFLMSMIPFLRGYIHISKNPEDNYSTLSNIMHGYNNAGVDIAKIYNNSFGDIFSEPEFISVDDVLNLDGALK